MDPDVSRASTRSTGRLVVDGDVEEGGVTETSVCEEEGVYVMVGEVDDSAAAIILLLYLNLTSVCMYVCTNCTVCKLKLKLT